MPLPPVPLSVAVPRIVWRAAVTTNPDAWLVIVNVGGVTSAVAPEVTLQRNERDTVLSPSLTKMVTSCVPALIGVPVIRPVRRCIVTPSGSPVCVNVNGEASGSMTLISIGEIGALAALLRLFGAANDGIENLCSVEKAPRPLELSALTATYTSWPAGGANSYAVWLASTVANWMLHDSEAVPMHTS